MRLVFSRHALLRMTEPGISVAEVRHAVLKGAKRRQDGRIVAVFRYFEVVYRVDGENIRVITVKPRW